MSWDQCASCDLEEKELIRAERALSYAIARLNSIKDYVKDAEDKLLYRLAKEGVETVEKLMREDI